MLAVANYHYIRDDFQAPYPSIFGRTPKEFENQLEVLAKQADFISLEELLDFRNRPFDKNYLLITFDDGLREQYELAKPILDRLGIPFIFFINTSNFQDQSVSLVHKIHLLRSEMASEDLLAALESNGIAALTPQEKQRALLHYNYDEEETAVLKYMLNFRMDVKLQQAFIDPLFAEMYNEKEVARKLYFDEEMLQTLHQQSRLGSHSHRHLPLGQLSLEEMELDLQQSQEFFVDRFGVPARAISYPYGSWEACSGIRNSVQAQGFELGFTMERALSGTLTEDSYLISRFDCNDLPLGKNNLFGNRSIFDSAYLRKWQHYENSPNHQQ